jgi:hypothetical protein
MSPKIVPGNLSGEVSLKRNPYQEAFLDARRLRLSDGSRAFNRFTLIAGRRGGKTRIGAVALAEEAAVPETIHWACAPSYPELHDYVLPAVMRTLPAGWIADWSAQHYELLLKNKTKIQFRSLDDPERGRGPGIHSAWLDEVRKIAQLAWQTLRPALADFQGAAYFTTSPNGFDWVYKKLYKPALDGRAGYWACRYKTSDNPIFQSGTMRREIDEARETMDPLFFQQEYEAEFVHFTGSIYGQLLDTQVLTSDDEIRAVLPEWPRVDPKRMALSSIDPGSDHPFAGVLALVTDAGLVFFNEYLERNKPITDHVAGIKEMEAPFFIERRAYDRSQKQWAIELAQHGLYCIPAENDVVAGIQRVQSWLKMRQMWFIQSRVPKTIEQMRSYRWNENFGLGGETSKRERVIKVGDDLPDGVRYLAMLYPELPKIGVPTGERDPRTVPAEARWAWERLRRCEGKGEEGGENWANFSATTDFDDGPDGMVARDDESGFADFYR